MAASATIPRYFDRELQGLKQNILRMATLAEEAVQKSLASVATRNSDLARDVIVDDIQLNDMELEIEDQAFKLLALRQPVATDLRLITAAMRIATQLERIGDQGVNIAERALELNILPPLELPIDLKSLEDLALGMVRTSIDAFVQQDPQLAIQVCQRDTEVDLLDDEYTQKLLDTMISESRWVTRLHHFIIIVRNLERIADLATNIAEDIVFIVEGKVIRHRCEDWALIGPPT
jgi:phosphate transport system protein